MGAKITVVGAGNVGATCALYLAQQGLGEIVLTDVVPGVPQGKALDIVQSSWPLGIHAQVTGSNDNALMEGSSLVIITAGLARKPGMDRLDLLKKNADIVGGIVADTKKYAPDAIIIMVTNPIDVMVYHAFKIFSAPSNRVIGQAGVLDSSRFTAFISMEIGCPPSAVQALVLGGHGDSMVPLTRYTTVYGVPVSEFIPKDRLDAIVDRTRNGGGEIVKLLGTGSAYYAPAASTVRMANSILNNRHEILPSSCLLNGQYGIHGVYVGVPARLGREGVEEIVEFPLNGEESQALKASAEIYKKSVAELYPE